MSPSRTHPTGLDRIIGIISFSFFHFSREVLLGTSFPMATAGLLTCVLKLMASGLPKKNVSDHGACRNKTLTAAGLSGLLTRFPFNHYTLILPEAAEGGSEPIAGAKVL